MIEASTLEAFQSAIFSMARGIVTLLWPVFVPILVVAVLIGAVLIATRI